ncbi:MAG: glycosyltransferase family 2 protein [Thermodesulfobacteriota bacterium]|nr:glycosyltransferase family 2 protein [Thermodesulfobacteriota bacterium]
MNKVSIITVCFNSAATIRDTIESVLFQDYPDIEYIIVDGASQDRTLDIVDEYRNRIATVISEPDNGIYDAMNKGIQAATGDIVGILNSDDFYADDQVIGEVVAEFVISNVDSVYADLAIVSRDDKKYLRYYGSEKFTIKHIRFGWMIPHPTFFVKRKYYEKFGLYKTNYRVAADFELLTRFLWREKISHKRLPKCIIKMRHGGISSHGLWWRFHQNLEIVRACRENGIRTNIFIVLLKTPFKLLEYLGPTKFQE